MPKPMMDRKSVAELLGVSVQWLKISPDAPPFVAIGPGKHGYRPEDLEAWLVARTVNPAERRAA